MHKLLLSLIAFSFLTFYSEAQICTGDFEFYTQTELDQFLIDNPACTSIEGDVTIVSENGPDPVMNLDGLQNIVSVTNLSINTFDSPDEVSFSYQGLENLSIVIEDIEIGGDSIASLDGLHNITQAGNISMGFNWMGSSGCFSGLLTANSIIMEGSIETISVQTSAVNVFPSLVNCEDIDIAGSFWNHLSGFNALTSLSNLRFEAVWSSIEIDTLDAFHNLQSAEYLIFEHFGTQNFSGFEQLVSLDYMVFEFVSNGQVITFPSLQTLGAFHSWVGEASIDMPILTEITGHCFATGFHSISMPLLESVGEDFYVGGSYNWFDLGILELYSLDSIGGDFQIRATSLTSLNFPELDFVGGDVEIFENPLLTECTLQVFCNLIANGTGSLEFNSNYPGECNDLDSYIAGCSSSFVSGTIYADLDCDNVFNNDDVVLYGPTVINQDNIPLGTMYYGDYYVELPDNATTTLSLNTAPGFALSPSHTFTISDEDSLFTGYDFPLCPVGDVHNMSVYITTWDNPIPGFDHTYTVWVKNLYPQVENAIVVFDFSSLTGATYSGGDGGTVIGNTISLQVSDLPFMQSEVFHLSFYVNPSTPLGTIYTPSVSLTLDPGTLVDIDPLDNTFSFSQTVVGSFDPNDIIVNRDAVHVSEVSGDDGIYLDYTIRFQNTGTAPAVNIRLEDVIEEQLDLSTFQVIDASHPYQVSFEENREVEWLFENILLPDSNANEEESHGFIHFRIKTIGNLSTADVIESTAAIYFDFNEPVITNTATTVFYDCPQPIEITGVESICEGESIELQSNGGWTSYAWTLQDEEVGNEESYSAIGSTAGTYNYSLLAETEHCESMDEFEVTVHEVPVTPTIVQDGNTLTAEGAEFVIWYLEGEEISSGPASIDIAVSGNYSVAAINGFCISGEDSGFFETVGVENLPAKELSLIYNGNNTYSIRGLDGKMPNITVLDSEGRIVKDMYGSYDIDMGPYPSGVYMIDVKLVNHSQVFRVVR